MRGGSGPLGDAPLGVPDRPRALPPPEADDEPGRAGRRPGRARRAPLGPGDVRGAGPMTLLAGHGELRPGRRVAVRGDVVPLPEVGRVALGALEVPGLLAAGPVERVRGPERHAGIQVEPALPPVRAGPGVPRQAERLEPAVREPNEVLLERIGPEGVGDLELGRLPVRPVGPDDELPVAAEERRDDPLVRDGRLVEAAEHRLRGRGLHRPGVVGGPVGLHLARGGRWRTARYRRRSAGRREARCPSPAAGRRAGSRGPG